MSLDDCAPVMRVQEAAEVALVDVKTLRRAIHRGELQALVTGRLIRVTRESLRAWLDGGTSTAAERPRMKLVGRP